MDGEHGQSGEAQHTMPVVDQRDGQVGAMQVIARFPTDAAARNAASRLQETGIFCTLREPPQNNGARMEMAVRRDEMERAVEVLARIDLRKYLVIQPSEPVHVQVIGCPTCGSPDTQRVWPLWRLLIGTVVLANFLWLPGPYGEMLFMVLEAIWIPWCMVDPHLRCGKCGHLFKPQGLTAMQPMVPPPDPQTQETPQ
jgi:hypothetical protein